MVDGTRSLFTEVTFAVCYPDAARLFAQVVLLALER